MKFKTVGLGSLLFGISAVHAQNSQDLPELTRQPEPVPVPRTIPQPLSAYASSGATATSVLVHEQAADFWGAETFETFLDNPLQWGPFQLRPFGSYRFTYGNGVSRSPGNQVTTAVHEITPGAVLQSRHLSFRYAPTLRYYSSEEFEDGVDHSASASAFFGVDDWFFNLSHSFSDSSSPLIETGSQTDRQSHSTALSAHYQYSEKTSFDFSLSQSIQESSALNSSKSWSSMNWINYHWNEKLVLGAGLGGGYTIQDFGFDMTHEQIQARVAWSPGEKLDFSINGGFEFRQFVDSPFDDQVNPLFGASIGYRPWESTTFSLSANRRVGSSLLQVQTTETTSLSAGIRQRLLEVLHLDLFARFSQQDYKGSSTAGVEPGTDLQTERSDDILSFSATLGTRVFKKGDVSIFYQHSQNESTTRGYTYDSEQYGLQISYHF